MNFTPPKDTRPAVAPKKYSFKIKSFCTLVIFALYCQNVLLRCRFRNIQLTLIARLI